MGFRNAVDRDPRVAISVLPLGTAPRVEKTAAAISDRLSKLGAPKALDLDELAGKLRTIADTGDWSPISERDLRHAALCIWEKPAVIDNERFRDAYFSALSAISSRVATKLLIRSYFVNFDPGSGSTRAVGRYLESAVERWAWPWRDAGRKFKIFRPTEAPDYIAMPALETRKPDHFLETIGMRGDLASSQFAAACFRACANVVGRQLGSNDHNDKLLQPLIDWFSPNSDAPRFPGERPFLATSLLLPWSNTEPTDAVRNQLINLFLHVIGDPRLSSIAWKNVNRAATEVMLRWLAQGSLEQFLRVVDKVAPGHQWEFRRAFWGAYIRAGFVRDAWVVFAPAGQRWAERLSDEADDTSMSRFGKLTGFGDKKHAVLLLRIGDLVVGDWSHNGTLRIWKSGNSHAPAFYKPQYSAFSLRDGCDFSRVHLGHWQYLASEFIRRQTKITIDERDYMPRQHGRR